MASLAKLFQNLTITSLLKTNVKTIVIPERTIYKFIKKPQPGAGQAFRRIVHYPDEYTVKPLEVTNLAGRDPVTGRVVAKGIGGGIKHKYHWVQFQRDGPQEGPPQIEKVIDVIFDGCRTAKVALVAVGDQLKYIIASENMKPGDLLKSSRFIPRIPGKCRLSFSRCQVKTSKNFQFERMKETHTHWAHYQSTHRSIVWRKIPAIRFILSPLLVRTAR